MKRMEADIVWYEIQRKWWPLCSPRSPQLNMFNLMSNCCSWVSQMQLPIRKVRVLVVGLDKAGKTSSVRGMLRVPPVDVGPTFGCVRTDLRVDNFAVTLLDTGGAGDTRGSWRDTGGASDTRGSLRGSWREHCGEVHGVVFVVDSSDRQRIKEVKELLGELLKQPRVAGKPILVLANKQDKLNALLGSELIEILALEKLVNESQSLCHIEPCSALMDVRRWSDKKTLRGLRWLLRAVCLDYPELCARIAQDSRRPLGPEESRRPLAPAAEERERRGKVEAYNGRSKSKEERIRAGEADQVHRPQDKSKTSKTGSTLQRNILKTEKTLKKKLTRKKKKRVKIKDVEEGREGGNEEEEEETEEGTEGGQEQPKEKANGILLPPKLSSKLKRRTKVTEGSSDQPESFENDDKAAKVKGEKKKKKKVKKKNKITTEEAPGGYSHQPVDLSATFDLYRKAMLTLKERQGQST